MSTYLVKNLNLITSLILLTSCELTKPVHMDLPQPLAELPKAALQVDALPEVKAQKPHSGSQNLQGLPEHEWRAITTEMTDKLQLPQQPVVINVDAMPLNAFIHLALSEIMGLSFELDADIAKREDPITIHVTKPLKSRALLEMVEQALRAYDVFLAWSPEGLRVLPVAKAAGSVPQVLSENARMLLKLGRAMTVIPLRYAAPSEALAFVRHFMDAGQMGDVTINTRLNALVVVGMPDRIAAYQQAIDLVDRPAFVKKKLTLVRPVYWQAGELAKVFNQFLQAQNIPVSKTETDYGVHLILVEPINAIVIVSPEQSWMTLINEWLEQMDTVEAAGEENNTYVYFVKHGNAESLGQVLSGVLGGGDNTSKSDINLNHNSDYGLNSGIGSGSAFGGGSSSLGGTGSVLGGSNLTLGSNGTGSQMGAGSSFAAGASSPSYKESGNTDKGGVDTVQGKDLRVVIDKARNALVFVGSSRAYQAAYKLLQQVDRMPRQILIEATVADITLDQSTQLGVEWSYSHKDGANIGKLASSLGVAAATGGLNYLFLNEASGIQAQLNALATNGNAKILSSPRLLAKDNEQATIQVGQQIPVISGEVTNTASNVNNSGSLLRNFKYVDTGVILRFTPTILEGGQVELEVSQEVSDAGSSANNTPPIFKRKVETVFVADSGQTIMIGGLITHNETLDEKKVPFFGDLPLFGYLFNNVTRKDRATEMVILITPHIVNSSADAVYLTDAFQKRLHW